jgi:uncharacterized protein YfiM (DUF2279 family)
LKRLAVVLFFTLSITNAQEIPKDKQMHFVAGTITGTLGYNYVYSKTKDRKKAFVAGIITSIAVGICKESLDATQPGNKFDLKDLATTTLGGITVGIVINLFDKKKKKKKKKIKKRKK